MRAFCRDFAAPSLSDLLVSLRQYETPVTISGGASAGDLLSPFWQDVRLSYDVAEAPLRVRCLRGSGADAAAFAEELADFVADVRELPETPARTRVLDHLAATRVLVVVEYPPEGVSFTGQQTVEGVINCLVERSGGLAQRDGVGFLDEDDDAVILGMA